MNSDQATLIQEAATLIKIALNPRETAARNSQYQQLLQRFHTDNEFRETARHIARGLELQIFELPKDVGIAVVNIAGGPYAPNLNDFHANMRSRERIIYGLLIAMLTAYVYPNRRSLSEIDDTSVVSIELRPLVEWAADMSRQMKAQANLGDVSSEDLRAGFETMALLEPFGDGQDTLQRRFRKILQWFSEHGLFLLRQEGGKELWVARPHFRVQARHLMLSSHEKLIEVFRRQAPQAA